MEYKDIVILKVGKMYEPSRRIYERDTVEQALAEYNFKKVPHYGVLHKGKEAWIDSKVGNVLGDIDRWLTIEAENISHEVKDLRLDDDDVVRGTIVPTGPFKDILEFIMFNPTAANFTPRAICQHEYRDGVVYVRPGTMRIISIDAVIGGNVHLCVHQDIRGEVKQPSKPHYL